MKTNKLIIQVSNLFPKFYSRIIFPQRILDDFLNHSNFASIQEIRDQIMELEFAECKKLASLQGFAPDIAEILNMGYRQNLVERNLYCGSFTRQLILTKVDGRKFMYAAPKTWIDLIRSKGIAVSYAGCSVLYFIDRVNFSLKCLALYFKSSLSNFQNLGKCKRFMGLKLIYFVDVPTSAIHDFTLGKEFTVTSWYCEVILNLFEQKGKDKVLIKNWEVTDLSPINTYKPLHEFGIFLFSLFRSIGLLLNGSIRVSLFFFAFKELGNWDRSKKTLLDFRHVIFTRTSGLVKPLYAYEFEFAKGSVDYICYSADALPDYRNGETSPEEYWKLATWKKILAFDSLQSNEIASQLELTKSNIRSCGFPWWTDGDFSIITGEKRLIAFFDNPYSPYFLGFQPLFTFGLRSYESHAKLLSTILKASVRNNLYLLHKSKRNFGKYRNANYDSLISKTQRESGANYLYFQEAVSPIKVAKVADYIIAKPFSSAAFLAKEFCPKIIFLDISGKIDKNDPAARGIPILSTHQELENWIKEVTC
jgi:polysaccharide biosynthesis PFTS motif protein